MKVIYIAGAYRSNSINGIYDNIQKARKASLLFWKRGYAVICPHMNTAMMDGACPDDVWLNGYIELLKRSDVVVMLKNWERSAGAIKEHAIAQQYNKEIIYL